MPPVDEPMSFEPKPSATGGRKPKTPPPATDPPPSSDLLAVTLDAATGQVVRVEGVDAAGARHDLSDEEKAKLAKTEVGETLQGVIEEAFEAGIACALGDQAGETEPESEEDAELSRLLLRSLIQHSAAKRFMQRERLGRTLVRSLVQQALAASAAENAATH